MADWVLGVDAGNTKTIALVARSDGEIVGYGRSGCGDIYGATSEMAALAAISTAIETALVTAKISKAQLAAAVFSAAGADWPEDFEFLRTALAATGIPNPVIYNDAFGALRAGSTDGTGVVVACGTGAAIGARAAEGRLWHTSFWQQVGGAGDLANKALSAVYREELGFGPMTALTPATLEFFNKTRVEDVLHALTARNSAKDAESRFIHPKVGGLVRVLFDVAEAGDSVAHAIVVAHGEALGNHALLAARKVGIAHSPFTLVLTGGVLRHDSLVLRDVIVRHILKTAPIAQWTHSSFEPAIGALMLALETRSIKIDNPVRAQLQRTLPPASLFET